MDNPTIPLSRESRDSTANNAEKNTTRLPRDSRRIASHLQFKKQRNKMEALQQKNDEYEDGKNIKRKMLIFKKHILKIQTDSKQSKDRCF